MTESRFFDIVRNIFKEKTHGKRKGFNRSFSQNNPSPNSSLAITPKKSKQNEALELLLSSQDKEVRNLEKYQIARIQHKLMILTMALLEMRDLKESEIVMKRIVRALPKELIELKITQIYLQYRSLYNKNYISEAFGHVFFFF